jgi:hypothetical protein
MVNYQLSIVNYQLKICTFVPEKLQEKNEKNSSYLVGRVVDDIIGTGTDRT